VPSHRLVICNVCGSSRLGKGRYRTPAGVMAPSWECKDCLAITLDDSVAESEDERDSVRLAKAARAVVIDEPADLPAECSSK
jgi:hypothetical protein